ncbi:MAG: T9SS type A sorting domain-containing protein [bacterium]
MSGKYYFHLASAIMLLQTTLRAQTQWQEYPGNPVVTANVYYAMDPAVVYDAAAEQYRMWYTADQNGRYHVYYATSPDGSDWSKYTGNPVLSPGLENAWDGLHTRCSSVIFDGQTYKMYYIGSNAPSREQIGLATSTDGIHWQKYSQNPILQPSAYGTWDETLVYHPEVCFDGQTYFMLYAGYDGTTVRGGLATSADGMHWVKHEANPVLDIGASGKWDDYGVWPNSGIVFKDGVFYLLYSAASRLYITKGAIGLATSTDGVHWTKYAGNPVLQAGPPGAWHQEGLGSGALLFRNDRFKLWFSGHANPTNTFHIGYAEAIADVPCNGFPLPAVEAYGNINGGDESHADQVSYCLNGQPGNLYLSFEAYDIDIPAEVKIRLNGVSVFNLPVTSNNAWNGPFGVLLPDELINDQGGNELIFDNLKNPPKNWLWGVRHVSVGPFYALPSSTAYGKIRDGNQSHPDKVVYLFSGQRGDLHLNYEVYDIDNAHELDIWLNGVKVHDEATTANETWSGARTLLLPDGLANDAGINVLIFDNAKNPPQELYWGVRNVSVSLAPSASFALNLPPGLRFSGVAVQHAEELFNGQAAAPVRPLGDDETLPDSHLSGAATIGVDGYLIVDFETPLPFDAVLLSPELNVQRYFRYRLEASLEGQNWQTIIDHFEPATQGTQFVAVPRTLVRFLRLSGASYMLDTDFLPAGVSEEEFWRVHDAMIDKNEPDALALTELALMRQEKSLSVAEDAHALPAEFRLAQNYPNPFNPATTIEFDLPQREHVKLAIYNALGELVQTLAEGSRPAGSHIYTFDGTGLASGVYLCHLQAGVFSASRKLLLVR